MVVFSGLADHNLGVRRRQVSIDWDFAANGIWWVLTPEELAAPPGAPPEADLPDMPEGGWAELLPRPLIDELQAWNRWGESVIGIDGTGHTDAEYQAFQARGRELAAEVQRHLGPTFKVLCGFAGEAD